MRNLSDETRKRQRAAQKAWRQENLERFPVNFKKGELEKYKRMAANRSVSLASIIKNLLEIELKKEYGPMEMKMIGTADHIYPSTGSMNVDVWETADGRRICVSEWNGEMWLESWEIFEDMSTGPSFSARPVYRWQTDGTDPSVLEENSQEWFSANEIVGLDF